jgi:hypothetical protein
MYFTESKIMKIYVFNNTLCDILIHQFIFKQPALLIQIISFPYVRLLLTSFAYTGLFWRKGQYFVT